MFAATVLPIVFVVAETAPATASAPPESEIDGSTAAMLDVSLAVMLTSPSDVTTPELPMYALVRSVVVFVASEPEPLNPPTPPAAETLIVYTLIDAADTWSLVVAASQRSTNAFPVVVERSSHALPALNVTSSRCSVEP